jgi:hypothetical protein
MSARTILGRVLAVTAIAVPAVLGGATAATAAPPSPLQFQAGRLVLEPSARGYHGSIEFSVTNGGATDTSIGLTFVDPVAGGRVEFRDPSAGPCLYGEPVDGRQSENCYLTTVKAGVTYRNALEFDVLTKARAYAMTGPDVALTLTRDNDPVVTRTVATRFRSTTGSLRHARPYVQDTKSDITVRAGAEIALTEQPDGSFRGGVPVTVTYRGDAPHWELTLAGDFPGGVALWEIDPAGVCMDVCEIPGQFTEGETRTMTAYLHAPAGTPAGELGVGTLTVQNRWITPVEDVTPADNTVPVRVTVG